MSTLTHPLNIFLERIMTDSLKITKALSTLEAEQTPISALLMTPEELTKLVECLNKASTAYGMEISAEKIKLMTTPAASTKRSK